MTAQIKFLRKNLLDLNNQNATITITDGVATNTGQNSVNLMRNRDNVSGWLTTGSDDTADTVIESSFGGDLYDLDHVQLNRHNFKDFLIEYQDVSNVWQTYENVTDNETATTIHTKETPVEARGVRITVYSTIIADADKELRQFICTYKIHQFNGWPQIKKPTFSRNRRVNKMPSGRVNITKTRGTFSCDLRIQVTSNENDLIIHENLYERNEGVLLLITGGDETQFNSNRINFRNEDIVLVLPVDEYTNPHYKDITSNGIIVNMSLAEVDR